MELSANCKNAIIIPSCVDRNRGDQALVWEAIRLVKDVFGQSVKISIVKPSEDESELQQTKELGYPLLNPILRHPRRKTDKENPINYDLVTKSLWVIRGLWDLVKTEMLLSGFRPVRYVGGLLCPENARGTLQCFKKADAVFFRGGGSIHSYGRIIDWYYVYYFLFQIKLALRFNSNVYVLPNSIGPLKNNLARKMVRSTLKRCKLVTLREKISLELMERLEIRSVYSPDMGFYLKPSAKDFSEYLTRKGVPEGPKVAITVRPYRFMGHNSPERYYEQYLISLAAFSEYLVKNGYHVTLFMQSFDNKNKHEDDRCAMADIYRRIGEEYKGNISYIDDTTLDCSEVEKIYSYYDYLVGTRFHSVIFALNVGVPCIAIAYGGNKGQGIMKELGNDRYVIDIDALDKGKLVSAFEILKSERSMYLKRLSYFRKSIQFYREMLVSSIKRIERCD